MLTYCCDIFLTVTHNGGLTSVGLESHWETFIYCILFHQDMAELAAHHGLRSMAWLHHSLRIQSTEHGCIRQYLYG